MIWYVFYWLIQMDLIKIGKFIAQLRKEQGLTQEQFGEKMGVSNKTVSRWETGKYLPPVDALKTMSEIFGVSINEILSGKRLTAKEYKDAAEENFTQVIKVSSFLLKDRIEFYRRKWLKDHAAIMVFIGICIIGVLITGIAIGEYLLGYSAILMLIAGHVWRYNTMMAYIESHVYNDN